VPDFISSKQNLEKTELTLPRATPFFHETLFATTMEMGHSYTKNPVQGGRQIGRCSKEMVVMPYALLASGCSCLFI
jgi:hypothetical protein